MEGGISAAFLESNSNQIVLRYAFISHLSRTSKTFTESIRSKRRKNRSTEFQSLSESDDGEKALIRVESRSWRSKSTSTYSNRHSIAFKFLNIKKRNDRAYWRCGCVVVNRLVLPSQQRSSVNFKLQHCGIRNFAKLFASSICFFCDTKKSIVFFKISALMKNASIINNNQKSTKNACLWASRWASSFWAQLVAIL